MRSTILSSLLLAASIALPACTDDPAIYSEAVESGPPVELPQLANASVVATEMQLGTRVASDDRLRRRLALAQDAAQDGLELGPAFLTRTSVQAPRATAFVFVSNTSADEHCFVRAQDLQYRNAEHEVITTHASAYLLGSIGEKGELATDTCLAPGESGYIVDAIDARYDAVAELSLALDTGETSYVPPASALVPGPMLAASTGLGLIATNAGGRPAALDAIGSVFIAFDRMKQPLYIGSLVPCQGGPMPVVAGGASLKMCGKGPSYTGETYAVQARISFADAFDWATPPDPSTKRP
jgi:hypothetical protein